MSNCWRCGKETGDGVVECPEHCTTQITGSQSAGFRKIDMAKIHSLDELKLILAFFNFTVIIGSPAEAALIDFLED